MKSRFEMKKMSKSVKNLTNYSFFVKAIYQIYALNFTPYHPLDGLRH